MARILLLETDRQLAKACIDYFGQAGHSLEAFSDPQTAVLAADKHLPDAVIISLMLARRSGIEFLYELRSYADWQNIPVIITGALSQDEQAAFAAAFDQLGVSAYLDKQTTPLAGLLAAAENQLQPA